MSVASVSSGSGVPLFPGTPTLEPSIPAVGAIVGFTRSAAAAVSGSIAVTLVSICTVSKLAPGYVF